jgi:hypothetical protein
MTRRARISDELTSEIRVLRTSVSSVLRIELEGGEKALGLGP